ncbi:hypothetical protein ACJJTC_015445 [Scirpophaga incertulas]
MAAEFSTPLNTITKETLRILITNNRMDDSVEFGSDCESMQTDSPLRKPIMQLVGKKLFHSPAGEECPEITSFDRVPIQQKRKPAKRKQRVELDSAEKIKKVFIKECERDDGSATGNGMRQKVLLSLFHNKEYYMDIDM